MTRAVSEMLPYPMTVVIATLGGESLKETIEVINRGSIVPAEILICIPAEDASKVQKLSFRNVKVLVTGCRGQVAQRAEGFRNASHEVVMQLDDDMLVEEHCIEYLLETIKSHAKVAVAPSLINRATGESTYKKPAENKILRKIHGWLTNGAAGYQPGKIDKSGSAIGIDPGCESGKLFEVEWLAGGCVMHCRENLVLEPFYPFPGKAYYEDIIHSHYLKSRGIELKIDARARCWLECVSPSNYSHADFIRYLMADYRARNYFLELASRSSMRIYIYYLAAYLNYLRRKLTD